MLEAQLLAEIGRLDIDVDHTRADVAFTTGRQELPRSGALSRRSEGHSLKDPAIEMTTFVV